MTAQELLAEIHKAMESVRFTGRMKLVDGKWVGVYGNEEPKE